MKRLKKRICWLIFLLGTATTLSVHAQSDSYDSLLNYYLASDSVMLDQLELELAADSLDILDLIDSLIRTDFRYSQMSVRLGYTSNITYAGRNFGIQQYGFGMGASYYHKSGLFTDVSGYWNSDITPAYNPTILSAGYMGILTKKWTFTTSYDHYFYQKSDTDELAYYPITNSANISTYLEWKHLTFSMDYSYMFGEEQAHRLRGNVMLTLAKDNWGFIDRFVFMPTASLLMGNAYVYQLTPVYPTLNLETRYAIRQIMFEQYGEMYVRHLWRNQKEEYLALENEIYQNNKDQLSDYIVTSDNVFGIMNYSLSAPFYFYLNNFTFALSYHYNIPVALPGEELTLENNSYLSATLIYNIPLRKKNKN